jgi:hypothetical protein
LKAALLVLIALAGAPSIPLALAQNCFELGNCAIDEPFTWISAPYEAIIGDYVYPLVWGAVLSFVYIKTEKAELVIVLGVVVLAGFIAYNPTIITNSNTGAFIWWGVAAACVAFGCSLYYLLRVRVTSPM